MGVKHVAVSAHRTGSDAMALVYDIDIRWAGSPDISLLLAPSRKWIVKQRRIGAAFLGHVVPRALPCGIYSVPAPPWLAQLCGTPVTSAVKKDAISTLSILHRSAAIVSQNVHKNPNYMRQCKSAPVAY